MLAITSRRAKGYLTFLFYQRAVTIGVGGALLAMAGFSPLAQATTLALGSAMASEMYFVTLGVGGVYTCQQHNCIRVDIADRYGANGGVFLIEASGGWNGGLPTGPGGYVVVEPAVTALSYTVQVTYDHEFEDRLTSAQHVEFGVKAYVEITPTYPIPGNPNAHQTLSFSFGYGADDVYTFTFMPNWVDTIITVRFEVAPHPAHLLNSPNTVWRWETLPQRVRLLPDQLLEMAVLPIGLVGKPPGGDSWSSVTHSEGAVVKMGIKEENGNSHTYASSGGIGPITLTSQDEVTTERRESEGTYQLTGYEEQHTLRSAGPYRNGEGDLLVVAVEPEVYLYNAPHDIDFQLKNIGGVAFFPMIELMIQRDHLAGQSAAQSGIGVVRGLSQHDIERLIALHPLLENPRARLSPPRFHQVGVPILGITGIQSGQLSITSTDIQSAVQSSSTTSTTDDSLSLEVPFDAAIKLITGYDIPGELVNPHGSNTDITRASVELVTSQEITRHSGTVYTYEYSDSNNNEFCIEKYFDSLFNALVFRDCTPAPNSGWTLASLLAGAEPEWLKSIAIAEGGTIFDKYLVGKLNAMELTEGTGEIRFVRDGSESWTYVSQTDPKTGAFALANVRPGDYTAKVGSFLHRLSVTDAGDVYHERTGKDGSMEKTYTSADGTTSTHAYADACLREEGMRSCTSDGARCTTERRSKDVCSGRQYWERCETDKYGTVCKYDDNGKSGTYKR
jgi:hypothetical protein